ncbi:hypothetical protein HOLleu_30182 [Holothuria leucospilota]|uniref:DNA-directed DNA polymerase n=1 Tax=Holothuria leucospilota TaxID=206669 RepID=A0A9Q1BKB7_HOLLE|nr:hypothetical protein HOLleu_30182 [Holothuria leucospilota]
MVCDGYISKPFESRCPYCVDTKQVVFSGPKTQSDFGEWCLKSEHATFIAHNFKGFDGYFIIDYLYSLQLTPNIITMGGELKNGYFPHLFNKSENQQYVGPLPDVSFYSPNSMSTKKRSEFLFWYEKEVEKSVLFDFQKELLTYCVSDVDILRQCCLLFRGFFMEITKIPISKLESFGNIPTLPFNGYIMKVCKEMCT